MEREGGFSTFPSGFGIPPVTGEDISAEAIANFDAMFSGVSLQSLVADTVGAPVPPPPLSFHYLTEEHRFVAEAYETYKSNACLDSAVSENTILKKPKLEPETESSTHSLPPLPSSFISDGFLQLPLLDSSDLAQKLDLADSVKAPPPPPLPRPRSNLARQRRQTVSEKIRCLQKLMPWDKKMPIAKMLEEAYKYVRFLEAQIKALKSMPCYSSQTLTLTLTEESSNNINNNTDLLKLNRQQLLEVLINSPVAQTMMYSKGYCVVSAEQLVALNMNIMHPNSSSINNVGGGFCEGNSSNRVSFLE